MSESALSEGSLIAGRYRLEHPLGEGGMGPETASRSTLYAKLEEHGLL